MTDYVRAIAFIFDLLGNEFATQLFIISLVFAFIFEKRKLFWLRYLGGWALIVGTQWLIRLEYFPMPAVVNYVFVLLLLFGIYMLGYKIDGSRAAFLIVLVHGVQFALSNVTYIFINALMAGSGRFDWFMYYYIEMPILFVGGTVAAYFLLARPLMRMDEIVFHNKVLLYCVAAFVTVAVFFTHYARMSMWFMAEGVAYLLAIATLFDVATIIICYLNMGHKRLKNENNVLQELLRKDKRRYEQAAISNEKIMIKYHDIKQREHSGIVDYEDLAEIAEDREILNSTYFTGNPALDVVLSEKALLCERLGIRLICTAEGEAMDFMKPHHIYSLVGNALENSIESVRHEKDEANREIKLSVVRRENMCVFTTSNYVSREVTFDNGLPVTDKPNAEEHGFGTRSMRNVVNKYAGELGFYQDGDIFSVTVMLPCPESDSKKASK